MNCPRCDSPSATEVLQKYGGVCPKCLAEFTGQEDAPAFPGLEIQALLGEGGMGVVYKARQTRLDRTVALKVLSPALAADPSFIERFTREAKALAQLNHPNIVAVHDFGIHEGVPYLIMEFVEGVSLRKLIAHQKLPPEQALAIIPQICDALQYAHGRGVVHRDIKPENILFDSEGRVKIADFGLAKLGTPDLTRLTRSNAVMGTPHYMAPEQVENPASVDHRADIFSLGVVFYEMLTGGLPLGSFDPPSRKSGVDARLDPIILKALAKEPDRRYQHASDMKEQVTTLGERPQEPTPDYCEFEEACGILGVTEDRLKHLIKFGHVKAYRDNKGPRMKFRRSDLLASKQGVSESRDNAERKPVAELITKPKPILLGSLCIVSVFASFLPWGTVPTPVQPGIPWRPFYETAYAWNSSINLGHFAVPNYIPAFMAVAIAVLLYLRMRNYLQIGLRPILCMALWGMFQSGYFFMSRFHPNQSVGMGAALTLISFAWIDTLLIKELVALRSATTTAVVPGLSGDSRRVRAMLQRKIDRKP